MALVQGFDSQIRPARWRFCGKPAVLPFTEYGHKRYLCNLIVTQSQTRLRRIPATITAQLLLAKRKNRCSMVWFSLVYCDYVHKMFRTKHISFVCSNILYYINRANQTNIWTGICLFFWTEKIPPDFLHV